MTTSARSRPRCSLYAACTDVVGVAFDLDEDALRVRLQLVDHLVEARLGGVGQRRTAEAEVALVFAQRHFVNQSARVGLDGSHATIHDLGRVARVVRRQLRGVGRRTRIDRRTPGRFGLGVHRGGFGLGLPGPLLRLFERGFQACPPSR